MNALILLAIGLAMMATGYLLYSKYLSSKVFQLRAGYETPAHSMRDGVDYVPTNKFVLWGHHFTSVAGAAPIVGPAIAVIWGWLPAFLWVTIGTVFIAGMHDLGALWASTRHKGQSIGTLSGKYIGSRGRNLFLVVIFLLLLMVVAAFAVVITGLLVSTPTAVIPTWGAIVVALLIGQAIYRLKWNLPLVSVVGVVALYSLMLLGDRYPVVLPEDFLGIGPQAFWILALFIYGAIASLLPVWVLLQPRDYINGLQLFVGLGILYASFLFTAPTLVAPMVNRAMPEGAPSMVPLLFVTIACGAISGFHGVVASGTSSKQIDKETDERFVGYFGAVGEGLLALGAIISTTAGYRTVAEWEEIYSAFGKGGVAAFVQGGGNLLNQGLGISTSLSATILATMAVLFAATTMDTGIRLQRMVVQEIGEIVGMKLGATAATLIAVIVALALTFSAGADGSGGMLIWPLFGTTNQLMAALTLAIICVILSRLRRSYLPILVPLVFVMLMSIWALVVQLGQFYAAGNWLLLVLDVIILVAAIWVSIEALAALRKARELPAIEFGDRDTPEHSAEVKADART
ncbi:carbon starvation protein A [Corynebacterium sp. 153RC1]|uniref:carbon starvation CstA family protein n=1 Tax=unclassified Corynebacterium TaxID=2624378 RepID=UPI00211C2B21|nr:MULTISPECIES: carbon starvation protein A [unclassified Corynebacterium]MCQ9370838.1 carbon starvation protein A [Corynebacterium sp. 35RC1]MCQ9352667.1 carbon starvation protein A [Corynebacterium sp. 209RC1]MCQ9354851.1 carbon starvation protein A [Corynebacterium sp. 1222RC1]MCQ9357036.1 carbon starvation protein A [Corynebacterium sp. 122RC1]MCQ9359282.1 carbon starvation protein A [Corynebacterium sp. 142RC1]